MRTLLIVVMIVGVAVATGFEAVADEPCEITWGDLIPQEKEVFDDPFEKLTEDQLYDLGLLVRIRWLIG